MSNGALTTRHSGIPTMAREDIQRVRDLESALLEKPQGSVPTHHVLHAGMYARTIRIPAGVVLTGAEIKRATVLIVSGRVLVTVGNEIVELAGYHVLPASAGRKQAFYALEGTDLTMIFPTNASVIEEAENEFTDEPDRLLSRQGENTAIITGE